MVVDGPPQDSWEVLPNSLADKLWVLPSKTGEVEGGDYSTIYRGLNSPVTLRLVAFLMSAVLTLLTPRHDGCNQGQRSGV